MSKWPLVDFILGLEGFEFAVFWVSAVVILFGVGFAIDIMLGRQGIGPYWNAVLAFVGGYAGLYAHQKYLLGLNFYEPYLTAACVLAGIIVLVVIVNIVRARL